MKTYHRFKAAPSDSRFFMGFSAPQPQACQPHAGPI
ncbi:hypothetical protein ABH912_001804 [Pseudomonas sp. BT76 TE3572]